MNILNSGFSQQAVPPQIMQSINQIKQIRNLFSGNTDQIIQQFSQNNPAFNQVVQMCQGKDPRQVFEALCKQRGLDSSAILNELRK